MDHLRDQVLSAFEFGTLEELASVLSLLLVVSNHHPQNTEAGPIFDDLAGFRSYSEDAIQQPAN